MGIEHLLPLCRVRLAASHRSLEIALLLFHVCLLYTSDAADERSSVDLGGRRIIKKKKILCVRRMRQTWIHAK